MARARIPGIEFFKNCSDSSSYDQSASVEHTILLFLFLYVYSCFNEILRKILKRLINNVKYRKIVKI